MYTDFTMTQEVSSGQFSVVSWNILFDKSRGDRVPSQQSRLNDIIATLDSFERPVDVMGLLEVEKSADLGQHGEIIAEKLGYGAGSWQPHSRKREHIGMCGAAVEDVEFVDIGHNRLAAVTRLGDMAIAAVHLKRPPKYIRGGERTEEMGALLDYLGDVDQAVIMGDFNSLAAQRPRRMLARQSFKSVFTLTSGRRPQTIPTPDYEFMLSPKEQRWLKYVRPLLSIDDIYVKNLDVLEAGTLVGESDHVLLHATLER